MILEFEKAATDRFPSGKRAQVIEGDLVLGVHPLEHFGRLVVFEPAVGVFDTDSVKLLRDVVLPGLRIVVAAAAGGEGREEENRRQGLSNPPETDPEVVA